MPASRGWSVPGLVALALLLLGACARAPTVAPAIEPDGTVGEPPPGRLAAPPEGTEPMTPEAVRDAFGSLIGQAAPATMATRSPRPETMELRGRVASEEEEAIERSLDAPTASRRKRERSTEAAPNRPGPPMRSSVARSQADRPDVLRSEPGQGPSVGTPAAPALRVEDAAPAGSETVPPAGVAFARRPAPTFARTERLAPPRAVDLDSGRNLELRAVTVGVRIGGAGARARVVVDHVLRVDGGGARAPRLEVALPSGAEPEGLFLFGARTDPPAAAPAAPIPSRGPPATQGWGAPRVAAVRPATEAESPRGSSSRLVSTGDRLVAVLPALDPGRAAVRVAVAYTLTLTPTSSGYRLDLPLPQVPASTRLRTRVDLESGLGLREGVPLPRPGPVAPGSRLRLEIVAEGRPVARGRFDATHDAVFAVLRPPGSMRVEPPRVPAEAALFVVDGSTGADLDEQARAIAAILEGPAAPSRFAVLVHDVESIWLPGPSWQSNSPGLRRRILELVRNHRAEGASSFEAVGRAVEAAGPWLLEAGPRGYWLSRREPSWGGTDPEGWLLRYPALASIAFTVSADVVPARALAVATGGRVARGGPDAWGHAASSGPADVDVRLPGAREIRVLTTVDDAGPVVWAAALVPRGRADPLTLVDVGGRVIAKREVPRRADDRYAARAFAELDTRLRGPRAPGVQTRCVRFRIACRGLVFTLGAGPPPDPLPPVEVDPAVARDLGRIGRPRAPSALVGRPFPASARRAALEASARDPALPEGTLLELARARAVEGDTLGAVRALSRLVHRAPGDPARARLVAYALLALGQHRSGRELLEGVLALRPFEARSHFEVGLARELDGDGLGAAEAWETVLAGGDRVPPAVQVAAARRYLGLLARAGGPAARARRGTLAARHPEAAVSTTFALLWSSARFDLDLWVLEPDGARCEPGRGPTPLGGRSPWNVVDARGPEIYLPPGRPGRYDALVHAAGRPGPLPVGALFWVDGPDGIPRLRARWIPWPGFLGALSSERL